MSDPKWEGWINQATWYIALQIQNDFKLEQAAKKLAQKTGKIDPIKLAQLCSDNIKVPQGVMNISLENGIDMDEIKQHLEIQFADAGMITTLVSKPPAPISALTVLSTATLTETNVAGIFVIKINTGHIDRSIYTKVDKLLKSMGGTWNRKEGGHIFDGDPTDKFEHVLLTGSAIKSKKWGYFPTPEDLARKIIYLATLNPGEMVLEPSAGQGGLAIPISKIVGIGNVKCIEVQKKNCKVLKKEGFWVKQIDFMEQVGRTVFSKIVMNPPFEKQADIDHVLHAYHNFLKPGGKLVAIMSAGVKWRENKKTVAFRELVESIGGYITSNPPGSFKLFGTAVETVHVVMNKPE